MPHVSVAMYPGRSTEIKEKFAEKLQNLVVEELGCQKEHVSVEIEEVEPQNWKKEVEEKMNPEKLVIKPNF